MSYALARKSETALALRAKPVKQAVGTNLILGAENDALRQSSCLERNANSRRPQAGRTLEKSSPGSSHPGAVPPIVEQTLLSPGQPLDMLARRFFEPRFGCDFSRVRIHTGPKAADSAREISAVAYTSGNKIVFGSGNYQPNTDAGRRLLAHELTHVVQQGAGSLATGSRRVNTTAHCNIQRQVGWSDATRDNRQEETIDQMGKRNPVGSGQTGVDRIPLEHLTGGNQNPSMTKRGKEMQRDPATGKQVPVIDPATQQPKIINNPVATAEKADGKAIAIVPTALDPTKPVEILLHLHGYNEGYRQVDHSVRDVDIDRIEQQIIASGHPQLIGILPQGTTASEFGARGFNSDPYIDQVLARIAAHRHWAHPPTLASGVEQVALSAHSGGGNRIQTMLPGTAGTLPSKLKELVLFEAINGPGELAAVKSWVTQQIQNDVNQLKSITSIDQQAKYLSSSRRLRGYYTPQGSYVANYADLNRHIQTQFQNIVDKAGLDPSVVNALKRNYVLIQVTSPGASHENIMGQGGQLQDALGNLPPLPPSAAAANPSRPSTSGQSSGVLVQPKLALGKPGDDCEQEADRIAEAIPGLTDTEVAEPAGLTSAPLALPPQLIVRNQPAKCPATIQRQATSENLQPIRADEQGHDLGTSFTVPMDTARHPNKNTLGRDAGERFGKFSIFIPEKVIFGSRKEIEKINVLVFFSANSVVSNRPNDVLTHGLRGAANRSDWILIGVPALTASAGETISEQEITGCLESVGITGPINSLRLSGHSRGAFGLMNSIVQGKITSLSKIDQVVLLDADDNPDKTDPERATKIPKAEVLIQHHIPASKIKVYEVNVHKRHVADRNQNRPEYIGLDSASMAAIGYVRLIRDAMVTQPGIAEKVAANESIKQQLDSLPLPSRGSFTTGPSKPGLTSLQSFCAIHRNSISAILEKQSRRNDGLLKFINDNDLTRFGTNVPGNQQFNQAIAAHHFFVAEIAHELTE